MFGTPVIKQNIDAGEVNALAVSGPARLARLPDVPTFTEVGLPLPEIDTGAWFGILAPAGTPPRCGRHAQPRLQQRLAAILNSTAALLNLGLVPRGTSPEEFAAFIRSEIVRWPPIFSCVPASSRNRHFAAMISAQ